MRHLTPSLDLTVLPELTMPLEIDQVKIRNRIILAPMSGVSDLPFRQLAFEYGAGMVITEMVASRELVDSCAKTHGRLQGGDISPHVVQLAGREAKWMSEAARISADNGADMIDINMGCPAKKVIGGYSGCALMRDLDLALDIIEATVAAVEIPVSVKMRLGWDEQSINAPELAKRAEEAGVKLITVHGRTRSQFYHGKADWDAIRAVRDVISIPLIANGDVQDHTDIEKIMEKSGADGIMIGRQCQGRPWHCGALSGYRDVPESNVEISRFIRRHYLKMIDHYGEKIGIRHGRKHLNWYLERYAPYIHSEDRYDILSSVNIDYIIRKMQEHIENNDVETIEYAAIGKRA